MRENRGAQIVQELQEIIRGQTVYSDILLPTLLPVALAPHPEGDGPQRMVLAG
jgi:hypothetical protein